MNLAPYVGAPASCAAGARGALRRWRGRPWCHRPLRRDARRASCPSPETSEERPLSTNEPRYSSGEELASTLTHAVGAALSVAALVILVTYASFAGDARRVVSFSIYGASLIALYAASTFYHGVRAPRLKRLLRMLDHAAIFLLIAGTYTPVALVTLRGAWGWTLFGLIWGLAIAGLVLSVLFVDRFRLLTVAVYLGMGWLGVIAVKPMLEAMPAGGLLWLGLGGLSYTGGVAFYLWRRLPFNHAVWHLFVLGGSACHFFCFLFYVLHAAR